MKDEIIKTEYGYFSIRNIPSKKELKEYYERQYFQNNHALYRHAYSNGELEYLQNRAKVAEYILNNIAKIKQKKLLDVGAGEGHFANYFFHNNWDVTTLDYSAYGINNHNSELSKTLIQGDIFESCNNLIQENKSFNLINLSNVLEHSIYPVELLGKLKLLLSKNSLIRISVPNDYSRFQNFLLENGYTTNTWLCPPDHLHYFGLESLSNLLLSLNYKIVLRMGEFPIELFLTNGFSKYVKNKKSGKSAHRSRVEVDNFLFKQGFEKYLNYYKASAEIGLSRQIVMFATAKEDSNEDR